MIKKNIFTRIDNIIRLFFLNCQFTFTVEVQGNHKYLLNASVPTEKSMKCEMN